MSQSPKPCHNCRRQRQKCDRGLPRCLKCQQREQQCLGYGALLRWEKGLASRGKMAGKTYRLDAKDGSEESIALQPTISQYADLQTNFNGIR